VEIGAAARHRRGVAAGARLLRRWGWVAHCATERVPATI
jgi:hypothetical protein